mgnify:CR=1 FL=1
MVAGTGRFCSALIEHSNGSILAKTGAEGVYAVALPELGLGVAVKVEDGAGRASQVAVAEKADPGTPGHVAAPFQGVVSVVVEAGQQVEAGAALIRLEEEAS